MPSETRWRAHAAALHGRKPTNAATTTTSHHPSPLETPLQRPPTPTKTHCCHTSAAKTAPATFQTPSPDPSFIPPLKQIHQRTQTATATICKTRRTPPAPTDQQPPQSTSPQPRRPDLQQSANHRHSTSHPTPPPHTTIQRETCKTKKKPNPQTNQIHPTPNPSKNSCQQPPPPKPPHHRRSPPAIQHHHHTLQSREIPAKQRRNLTPKPTKSTPRRIPEPGQLGRDWRRRRRGSERE